MFLFTSSNNIKDADKENTNAPIADPFKCVCILKESTCMSSFPF